MTWTLRIGDLPPLPRTGAPLVLDTGTQNAPDGRPTSHAFRRTDEFVPHPDDLSLTVGHLADLGVLGRMPVETLMGLGATRLEAIRIATGQDPMPDKMLNAILARVSDEDASILRILHAQDVEELPPPGAPAAPAPKAPQRQGRMVLPYRAPPPASTERSNTGGKSPQELPARPLRAGEALRAYFPGSDLVSSLAERTFLPRSFVEKLLDGGARMDAETAATLAMRLPDVPGQRRRTEADWMKLDQTYAKWAAQQRAAEPGPQPPQPARPRAATREPPRPGTLSPALIERFGPPLSKEELRALKAAVKAGRAASGQRTQTERRRLLIEVAIAALRQKVA